MVRLASASHWAQSRLPVSQGSRAVEDLVCFLLFAVRLTGDTQSGHRPRRKSPKSDVLAAVFTFVDSLVSEALQGVIDFSEQGGLAVSKAELSRTQLFLRRFIERVPADRVLVLILGKIKRLASLVENSRSLLFEGLAQHLALLVIEHGGLKLQPDFPE